MTLAQWLDACTQAWHDKNAQAPAEGHTDLRLRCGAPVVADDRVAIEWWATMRDTDWHVGDAPTNAVTLPGCLMLQLAPHGRGAELRECSNLLQGSTMPAPSAGAYEQSPATRGLPASRTQPAKLRERSCRGLRQRPTPAGWGRGVMRSRRYACSVTERPDPTRVRPLSVWPVAVAGTLLAVLLATSARYGYHRDELYFIAAGAHPAFGYPDQPPLVPLLCHAMSQLAPGSLTMLRLPSALAAAGTTIVAALIAREVRGTARAQLIAAASTAVSGIALVTGHFVTTTTFDLLSTSLLGWLLIRAVARHSGPSLLLAGLVVGIGAETKPQIVLVAAVLLITLSISGPRWPLRSPWLAAGLSATVLLAAPYLIWQGTHGWPQLQVAHNIAGSAEGGRVGFLPFQVVMVSPLLVPLWVSGLLAPFRRPDLRTYRFLTLTYLLLAAIYIGGNGKAYYLASLYPTLLGLGAIPAASWTLRQDQRRTQHGSAGRSVLQRVGRWRTTALTAAVLTSAATSALIALPLLPAPDLQGSLVLAINPDQAETVGWPELVTDVAGAWNAIPSTERAHTVIFTRNYGEAGALDLLGPGHGLPQPYSGHNAYSQWGHPGPGETRVLLIGYQSADDAAPTFTDCHVAGHVDNNARLDNQERGLPILNCHAPLQGWTATWTQLTHYD